MTEFFIDRINKRIFAHSSRIDWLKKYFDAPQPINKEAENAWGKLRNHVPFPDTVEEIRLKRQEGYQRLNRFITGIKRNPMFDFPTNLA